ncbi:hypothetical protein [Mycobacterium sp. M23085]|uniref:hypothetical protein n=1 Tax=Mycobacterium sp. M23085 TaxID=3378087 RepID=UPI0038781E89
MVSRDYVHEVVTTALRDYVIPIGGNVMSYEVGDGKPVIIKSSFDIPNKLKQKIIDALAKTPNGVTDVRFEQEILYRNGVPDARYEP